MEGVVDAEVEAVESAPEHEDPCGTVPEPAEKHGDEEVEVAAGVPFSVAAEGEVEVVAEEGGECDVPASPELDDIGGTVG